jgi:hypothetical protein
VVKDEAQSQLYSSTRNFTSRLPTALQEELRSCERMLGEVTLARQPLSAQSALEALAATTPPPGAYGPRKATDLLMPVFHDALLCLLASRFQLTLGVVSAGSTKIAAVASIEHAGVVYVMRVGMGAAFMRTCAMPLVMSAVAADAHRRGMHELHCLGVAGVDRSWATRLARHVTLIVFKHGPKSAVTSNANEDVVSTPGQLVGS